MKVFRARSFGITLYLCLRFSIGACCAQDLAPRAYLITPTHSNAIAVSYSFFVGNIEFEGTAPITGATAEISVPIVSYYHSFNFFGHSSNFTASLPYGLGNFHGNVIGAETEAYRSGLVAPSLRVSANIIGGKAMDRNEFPQWQQTRILGASFRLVPLAGQYDPTKLINLGSNRWAFKPEIGYSERWRHWIVDVYGGDWFFTANSEFFSHNTFSATTNMQRQSPIASLETHLSYDFRPRLWILLDGNFWFGGSTKLNGVANPATGGIRVWE